MRRIAGIPASDSDVFLGEPARTVDDLVSQYQLGKTGTDSRLCGAYRGTSGLDSVKVAYSLAQDLPEEGKGDSGYKKYRMGEMALAGAKAGVLYFRCVGGVFGDASTAVLIRGDVRSRYEVAEPSDAATEDNLRIVHEASRGLSGLLGCESGSGVSGRFTMPPSA